MANALKEKYVNEVQPALIEKFNFTSPMQAPKIDKIVLNMGVGDAVSNSKNLDEAVEELKLIVWLVGLICCTELEKMVPLN